MKYFLVVILLILFSCNDEKEKVEYGILDRSTPSSCGGFEFDTRSSDVMDISKFKPDSITLEAFYAAAELYWIYRDKSVEVLILNQEFNCAAMPVMICDRVEKLYSFSFRDLNTGDYALCTCPFDFYGKFMVQESESITIKLHDNVYTLDLTEKSGSIGEGSVPISIDSPHEIILDHYEKSSFDASLSSLGNEFLSHLTSKYGYPDYTFACGGFWDVYSINKGLVYSIEPLTGDTVYFASDSINMETGIHADYAKMFTDGKLDITIASEKGDSEYRDYAAFIIMDLPGDYRFLNDGDFSDQKAIVPETSDYTLGWDISEATHLHLRGRFNGSISITISAMDSDSNAVFISSPIDEGLVDTLIPLESFSNYSNNFDTPLKRATELFFSVFLRGDEEATLNLEKMSLIYPSYTKALESFPFATPQKISY